MNLNIREATPDDAEGVVNILKPIIEAGTTPYMKPGFRIVGSAPKQARIDGKYIDEIIIERFL